MVLLELQVTLCLQPVMVICLLSSTSICKEDFEIFGSSTVTLQDFVCPFAETVMVAFPLLFAVTVPLLDMVATDLLLLDHLIAPEAFFTVIFLLLPFTNSIEVLLSEIVFGFFVVLLEPLELELLAELEEVPV